MNNPYPIKICAYCRIMSWFAKQTVFKVLELDK